MAKKKIDLKKIIKERGVALCVPETEYLNNEHITIHIYKKHFTKEEWENLKGELIWPNTN